MVLKASLTNEVQQSLHVLDFNYTGAAEGVQRIVGESALAHVSPHLAGSIVGGEAGEAHLFRLDQTDAGSEGVLLAHGAGNDLLKVHLYRAEEMFGQVGTVEADRLVRIRSIVVVPIEKSRRRAGGELQSVHSQYAANIHFAGAGKKLVAHHAHDSAGNDAQIFFNRSPALYRADGDLGRSHPLVDHSSQLRHLQ